VSKLLRDKLFRPGSACYSSLIWTNTATGERVGSIGYEAHLGQESGRVRLKYTTTRWDGEKRESDYWIQLETTPQPFGRRRWWFVCPRTHVATEDSVRALYYGDNLEILRSGAIPPESVDLMSNRTRKSRLSRIPGIGTKAPSVLSIDDGHSPD